MEVHLKVSYFLIKRAEQPYCADCLRSLLKIRGSLDNMWPSFRGSPGLVVEVQECTNCRRTLDTVRARAELVPKSMKPKVSLH